MFMFGPHGLAVVLTTDHMSGLGLTTPGGQHVTGNTGERVQKNEQMLCRKDEN